jgi:hypothetical protein
MRRRIVDAAAAVIHASSVRGSSGRSTEAAKCNPDLGPPAVGAEWTAAAASENRLVYSGSIGQLVHEGLRVVGAGGMLSLCVLVMSEEQESSNVGAIRISAVAVAGQAGSWLGRPNRSNRCGVRKAVISSMSAPRSVSTLMPWGMNARVFSSHT